jgi:leucyl/phenylalanyl-tRNA--protein transferase
MLTWLRRDSFAFPPLERALREPNGLLAAGGDLCAERLIQAYRHGCFPWYQEGQPILWWSPDPRNVLPPQEVHISRSLAKLLRQGRFRVTFDHGHRGLRRPAQLHRWHLDH